jgi:hypothetical protein
MVEMQALASTCNQCSGNPSFNQMINLPRRISNTAQINKHVDSMVFCYQHKEDCSPALKKG